MFYGLFLIFFLASNCDAQLNPTGEIRKISDKSAIIFSLSNYNVSNLDGESLEVLHTLSPNSTYQIFVANIPADVHFVVVQVHSYLLNITLSLTEIPLLNTSITGTNVGLLKKNEKKDLSFYLSYNNSSENVDVLVATQAYGIDAPIPGGCNMEFQVEVSPFLQTTFNEAITEVDFAPAAPPLSVLPNFLLYPNNECNIKPSPIQHHVYHRYFPERDFSKETYFLILKSLMTRSRILKNGGFVKEKLTSSPMRRIFASYSGTGNAFVVMSHFKNQTSVYVPSFSYACNDLKENNTCLVLTTTFSKVLCASIFFMGLFACFFGHYFFRVEVFLFALLANQIIFYILVSLLFRNSIALSSSVAIGLIVASVKLIAWDIFGMPVISVTLTTLVFGFLLASIIFYPLTDLVDILVSDMNFWGIFICIVVACPLLMMVLAEKANIISCSFVGSYVAIMSIDHYIGSNLRYIVVNTIRRATAGKFNLAAIGPPFQLKDLVLCFAWVSLMTSGIALQRLLMRNRPPYPPPVNLLKNLYLRLKGPSASSNELSETSPLLHNVPNTGVKNWS